MRNRLSVLAFAIAILASSSAFAQQPVAEGQPVIDQPTWLVRPPLGEPPLPISIHEYQVSVSLICRVSGDRLRQCQPTRPTSEKMLVAAIRSTDVARIGAQDASGHATEGRRVAVSVAFPFLVNEPVPNPNLVRKPVWIKQPTLAEIAAAYPEGASISGDVTLQCHASADTTLACPYWTISPEMRSAGFLAAARSLVPLYKLAAVDGDGVSTAGRPIDLVIHFDSPSR